MKQPDYGLINQGTNVEFPAGQVILLFSTVTIPALETTQPSIQWVLGLVPQG
jgi:hypothetical protein